jgi:hypothetical protein
MKYESGNMKMAFALRQAQGTKAIPLSLHLGLPPTNLSFFSIFSFFSSALFALSAVQPSFNL